MLDWVQGELTGTFSETPWRVATLRLVVAGLLAAVVGFERELRGKPAGLRTHILVSVAAALFILISIELAAMPFGDDQAKRVDPLRLIEAVTAGVAFLAAGVIFTSGGKVRNITTGASLWMAGAVGLACGAGQMPLAAIGTVVVVVVLYALRQVERLLGTHDELEEGTSHQDP